METTIDIKNKCGEIIFSHTCEDNSVKTTIDVAIKGKCSLRGADLCGANLRGANLCDANLCDAKNVPSIPMGLPEGAFVGWKKCKGYIIKLQILEDSRRSRSTGIKCRCDKALVLEIQTNDGKKSSITRLDNSDYAPVVYEVGKVTEADGWDENRWNECTHGIHFFIDRQSAVEY